MTEQEVIEIICDKIETCEFYFAEHDRYPEWCEYEFLEALGIAISTFKEIQQYRKIGTVEECREAVEKQKAKKPVLRNDNGKLRKSCSVCGCFFSPLSRSCPKCGQAIKWDENLEGMEDEQH